MRQKHLLWCRNDQRLSRLKGKCMFTNKTWKHQSFKSSGIWSSGCGRCWAKHNDDIFLILDMKYSEAVFFFFFFFLLSAAVHKAVFCFVKSVLVLISVVLWAVAIRVKFEDWLKMVWLHLIKKEITILSLNISLRPIGLFCYSPV